MIQIRTVDQLELDGATVFYRVDYNVPLEGTRVTDATRIEETLPTIKMLRERGARIIVASHLGRPKGKRSADFSLAPVRERLQQILEFPVEWSDESVGDTVRDRARSLDPGQILLLENLRFYPEEESNDANFARQLSQLADFYVNDAFGACHRAHASIVGTAEQYAADHRAGGLLLAKELEFLQKITNVSQRPFVALLGGAKIAGKIEPIEALARLADTILIGGGMANTFLAMEGHSLGESLVDRDSIEIARRIASTGSGAQIVLPEDLVVTDSIDHPQSVRTVLVGEALGSNEKAADIGPRTIARFKSILEKAQTIFWNGPMGVFETPEFAAGTLAMAEAVSAGNSISVVGGGESVEAVKSSGFADKISHISTGGGASLEFISGAKLPGIEVLTTATATATATSTHGS